MRMRLIVRVVKIYKYMYLIFKESKREFRVRVSRREGR